MSCTATIRKVGEVAMVDLGGRFAIGDGTGVIAETIRGLVRAGERKILMNLKAVTYLDSAAGIGGLVAGYTTAAQQGAIVKLLHAGKNVDYVLRIAGLNRVFEMYNDETTALESFGAAEGVAAGR